MSDTHGDAGKHVTIYMLVFAALVIGTILTVAVATVDLGGSKNILLAVLIAAVKASLVAAIFMHLKWEGSGWIWWPLAICAVFFAVLMLLPVLTMQDHPPGVKIGTWG